MDERINQQTLIEILIEKNDLDRKTAEKFVKEFFALIEESLEKNKLVKIKGLGTFKLVDVDSRESVNINTGERFVIEGYSKISFTPDSSIRDIINKPFAHFETVPLNEGVVLDDTITEIGKDDLSDEILDAPFIETPEEVVVIEEVVENVPVESVEPLNQPELTETLVVETQEDVIVNQAEEVITEVAEEIVTEDLEPTKIDDNEEEIQTPQEESKQAVEKESSSYKYLAAIIIVILLLCGGVVAFLYYPDIVESNQSQVSISERITISTGGDAINKVIASTTEVVADDVVVEKKAEVVIEQKPEQTKAIERDASYYIITKTYEPDSVNFIITGTKATHTVGTGETLTRIALRYYGTKNMWPYIVKHNPVAIKNPDNVPLGTVIKIPELTKK